MCGFFQVFHRNLPLDRARFESALDTMRHRGPDHTGTSFHTIAMDSGERVEVAGGHQRLSILDLDERSNQPFRRDGRCLLYNGEIYNFRELKAEMFDSTTPFTTTGDTEVLFNGLHRHGLRFLDRANGMWAFSHLDDATGRVTLARDRYGKKPLFYYQDAGRLCLSSTLQAIHHYLGRPQRLRDELVDSYLRFGVLYPPAGHETHLEDIRQVPPGGALEFDLRTWRGRETTWFTIAEEVKRPTPGDDELPALLHDAVVSRLVSDRKVGLLLSGGVDSTLVLSVICAAGLQDQVHCFIGDTGKSDDADYARQCVDALGIQANVVALDYGGDAFARVLKMCRHQEKPFPFLGSSMAMSEMYEHIAEQDVRVVLDGTGGDEIFGGYWDRYFPVAVREALATRDTAWLRDCLNHTPRAGALMWQSLRNGLFHNSVVDFEPRNLGKRWSPAAVSLGLHRRTAVSTDPFAFPPRRFLDALVLDASPGGRLGEWIWHNDRNAMMSGIENRSPILDYRLVRFMASGYAGKFHRQWNKHQLRKAFDAFKPLPTQWRQSKQGFRWDRKAFIRGNRDSILELIEASSYLASRYNTRKFVEGARKHRNMLFSGLTTRLLCIAGIEAELGPAAS